LTLDKSMLLNRFVNFQRVIFYLLYNWIETHKKKLIIITEKTAL